MIKRYVCLLAALIACLAPAAGSAGQVGEPAAPVIVSEWIKGGPVEVKPGTNVFVVEIFASSSLASQACITNLNAVQKRFKDQGVVVLAVSEEPADRLREFLERGGAKIEYAVAADKRRHTSLGFMMPVLQQGIPCAFIVGKDGKVLWHGHPEAGLNKALEEILLGTYNLKAAVESDKARKQLVEYLQFAQKHDPRTKAAGQMLLAAWTNNVALLCDLASHIATTPKMRIRDVELANAALDQAEKLCPTNTTRAATIRAILLFETGDKQEALARAREAIAAAKDPLDKTNAIICLRSMERRMNQAKSQPVKPAPTNQVQKAQGQP
jgi:hypothetical protein